MKPWFGFVVLLSSVLQVIQCQDGFETGAGGFQFGQKVDEESLKIKTAQAMNTTKYRMFLYNNDDNKPIAVYDKLFKANVILTIRSYLTNLAQDSWLFNNYDQESVDKARTSDNVPWINLRDPYEFFQMQTCKTLIKAIQDLTGDKSEFYPYKSMGKVIRRGDHTKVVADSTENEEYSALFYINYKWRKNWYGELYFYDDAKDIIAGVTPKPGRVVIWDSTIPRLTRPPSVSFKQGQVLFHVTFSKSKQKMMDAHDEWMKFWTDRTEAKRTWYLPDYKHLGDKPLVPNIADHVVANYSTLQGDKIFVFDNLFPTELLDHIRNHVLKYGTYFYDDSIDEESDNVQWVAGFLMQEYILSPYWKIVKEAAKFASGTDTFFPYDVSINLVRSADHTRIHFDVSYDKEKEWTFLIYLNKNWTQNNYGETTYYERNSDDTEIVAQVRPRYGRAVIFQGTIPHSARPPSLNFTGARLTFAVKLSENEFVGRTKNFHEDARHFRSAVSTAYSLAEMSKTEDAQAYIERMRKLYQSRSPEKPKSEEEGQGEGEGEGEGEEQEGEDQGESDGEEQGQGEEGATEQQEGEGSQQQAGSSAGQPQGEEEGGEGGEEEEDVPEVMEVNRKMNIVQQKHFGDAAKVKEVYDEMRKKHSVIMEHMKTEFPKIL